MADINKMRKEINIILAAAEAENEQKEKMIQLHIAIEEFCAKLLQDAIIGTTIAVITAKKTIYIQTFLSLRRGLKRVFELLVPSASYR